MNKNDTRSLGTEALHTRQTGITLHVILVLGLLCAGAVQLTDWSTVRSTIIGMVIAAVGGIAIGLVAYRYLGNSRNNREVLIGMMVTVGLGVLTIGYLYIIHIKGPMKSIGTINRTIKQTFIFSEFLLAQVSGIMLGKRYLP